MKILTSFLFVLSSVVIALADIPPRSPKGDKTDDAGICAGVVLFLMAITILVGWLLKKREIRKNE